VSKKCHKVCYILKTHKYQVPPYKIQLPSWFGTWDLCTPVFICSQLWYKTDVSSQLHSLATSPQRKSLLYLLVRRIGGYHCWSETVWRSEKDLSLAGSQILLPWSSRLWSSDSPVLVLIMDLFVGLMHLQTFHFTAFCPPSKYEYSIEMWESVQ
jgi:hypothetical protein